jgi:competence protein ComFC
MSLLLPDRPERRGWRKLADRLLDLLYPPVCAVCEAALRGGRSLCDSCDASLPRLSEPFCTSCGERYEGAIEGAFECPNCSDLTFSFEFARPALLWDERAREMIHRLKYGRELHLAGELGRLAAEAFVDPRLAVPLENRWPLVPVPLHRKRLQQRHFNQAEEIARALGKLTNQPVVRMLKRDRATQTQTRLSRAERLKNLKGAFSLTRCGRRFVGENPAGAILIDDVFTTGSTVDACAKALRKAGFRRVVVVTVMRG